MTRSPAATPVWIASSTRPDTVATCLVTTLLRRLASRATALRLALEAALAATDQALGTRARLAGLRLATALEAAQGDPAAARQRLGDVGGDAGDAVTRLQDGADVDQAGALGDVAALLRRRLGGGGVGLGGLARLVLRGGARATTGGLRRRLGGRRARGAARASWCACAWQQPSWRRRCASQQWCCCWWWWCRWWWPCGWSAPLVASQSNDISSKSVERSSTQRTHVCKPLPGPCYMRAGQNARTERKSDPTL